MKFTENEEDLFNDVYRHAKSGIASFDDIVESMEVYDDSDEMIGTLLKKSHDLDSLRKYDDLGTIDDDDDELPNHDFVVVKFLHPSDFADAQYGVYCYGDDTGLVHCNF